MLVNLCKIVIFQRNWLKISAPLSKWQFINNQAKPNQTNEYFLLSQRYMHMAKFSEYSKLRDGPLMEGGLNLKPYIQSLKLCDARTMFWIRTSMMPSKFNMKNNPKFASKLWKCDWCQRIDSQSHILWCPFFAPLREGKDVQNDTDLVEYFKEVFEIREEMEKSMNGSSWSRILAQNELQRARSSSLLAVLCPSRKLSCFFVWVCLK